MLKDIGWLAGYTRRTLAPKSTEITPTERQDLDRRSETWRLANRQDDSQLMEMVESLSEKAGLAYTPKLFIYKSQYPNASSMANGSLTISTAKLEKFSPEEINATLAHEITHNHQKHRQLGQEFAALSGVVLGSILATAAVAPRITPQNTNKFVETAIMATTFSASYAALSSGTNVIRRHIQRADEFAADRGSLLLTQDPENTTSLLQKCEDLQKAAKSEVILPTNGDRSSLIATNEPQEGQQENAGIQSESTQQGSWVTRINEKRQALSKKIYNTHPTNEERISHIERLKEQMEQGGAGVGKG